MNTTPNAPVIVVTEEKKRRKGMIWVAGGAALAVAVAGGATFALWSDSAAFAGGTITAGDLDLRKVAETAFYDISPDRDDIEPVLAHGGELLDTTEHLNVSGDLSVQNEKLMGHLIDDISTWRMVPGDTVAAVVAAQIHLVGDNLVAELSVDPATFTVGEAVEGDTTKADGEDGFTGEDQTNTDGFTSPSLSYTYTVYGDDGEILEGFDHVQIATDGSFTGHLAYFDASELGQDSGAADADAAAGVIGVGSDGLENITVVFEAVFHDTNNRVDVGAAEAIGSIDLSLTQLRAGTAAVNGDTGIGAQHTN